MRSLEAVGVKCGVNGVSRMRKAKEQKLFFLYFTVFAVSVTSFWEHFLESVD